MEFSGWNEGRLVQEPKSKCWCEKAWNLLKRGSLTADINWTEGEMIIGRRQSFPFVLWRREKATYRELSVLLIRLRRGNSEFKARLLIPSGGKCGGEGVRPLRQGRPDPRFWDRSLIRMIPDLKPKLLARYGIDGITLMISVSYNCPRIS